MRKSTQPATYSIRAHTYRFVTNSTTGVIDPALHRATPHRRLRRRITPRSALPRLMLPYTALCLVYHDFQICTPTEIGAVFSTLNVACSHAATINAAHPKPTRSTMLSSGSTRAASCSTEPPLSNRNSIPSCPHHATPTVQAMDLSPGVERTRPRPQYPPQAKRYHGLQKGKTHATLPLNHLRYMLHPPIHPHATVTYQTHPRAYGQRGSVSTDHMPSLCTR